MRGSGEQRRRAHVRTGAHSVSPLSLLPSSDAPKPRIPPVYVGVRMPPLLRKPCVVLGSLTILIKESLRLTVYSDHKGVGEDQEEGGHEARAHLTPSPL